jgi:hypothetical protein
MGLIQEAEAQLEEAETVLGIIRDAGRPSGRDEARLKQAKQELERLKKAYTTKTEV